LDAEVVGSSGESDHIMSSAPIRVGFVLHVMQVAGAEMLVAETIRRLGARIEPIVFCLDSIGALGEQLKAEGVPVVAYNRRAGLDLSVSWRMAKDLRSRGIQVVHAHQYTPFFYGSLAARLVNPRPQIIFTEHGRHYPDVTSLRRRLANKLIFDRLADRVNAVCEFSARSLADKDGFRPDRIEVIPNGIDPGRYGAVSDVATERIRLGLEPHRKYIACVARFHPVKDHETLLRAFAIVAAMREDVDLLLVGDGLLRPILQQRVHHLGLTGRVRFLGVRHDVAQLLRVVDIFTLTSVSEAASITLLEAMAAGRPVVVTAVGGNPELVRDGVDGMLAPRGDAEAIASAFCKILENDGFARRLGLSGAERVQAGFLLDQTVNRYYQLYSGDSSSSISERKAS
jgi:glycosyltransferase involved in cell wall biosynthesis